ncbi:MAG: SPOR domain-containing protein, partial [Burkholderiales bacterium]
VQLGAFSDATKAKNQQRSLESNGIKKAYTEMIKNENIEVTRVRVGPFSTREAAEKEQKKLKELGVNGVVINI